MFLIDGNLNWSASDLTAATGCEYSILRKVDFILNRVERPAKKDNPLLDHIARLGDKHEERLLEKFQRDRTLIGIERVAAPFTTENINKTLDATLVAFQSLPDVVFQAAFYDEEFFGYADFIEHSQEGWVVCDAKLARTAKPKALIQIAAYAEQVRKLGLPVSPKASLFLGTGERVDFSLDDLTPVFEERRDRLRSILSEHQSADTPVAWGDPRYVACGKCPECEDAILHTNDILGVAKMRVDQRQKFLGIGIKTMSDLAVANRKPDGMADATFTNLRAQAALQLTQVENGGPVIYEMVDNAVETLSKLPAPSPGDLFFDFEGDPLYDEGDPKHVGLEYLWGVLDSKERYTPTWAHSWSEERKAFVDFIEDVKKRRAVHPDMHIYHYAPYETSALKRLAMRYQTHEEDLDDLLRSEVFIDLYSTVRGSIRISQPSYSIKKLEPLYMGDKLRESDVADGGGSIIAYHQYRDSLLDDESGESATLAELADYNEYDCLSTLRLRDWLLERANELGVKPRKYAAVNEPDEYKFLPHQELFESLMEKAGPELRSQRTPEEQVYAMLATALDFFRRERKQFWWDHFERLSNQIDEWLDARDVFIVESAEIIQDWVVPEGRAKNPQRKVRLIGDWTAGSKPSSMAKVVYSSPGPSGSFGPELGQFVAADANELEADPTDPRVVVLTESRKEDEIFADIPVAIAPAEPPRTEKIEQAILEVAQLANESAHLQSTNVLDLLARRTPVLKFVGALPHERSTQENLVAALTGMEHSYVAVQGPPGTGKTFTGSRVVRELVEKHNWKIGIVAQSHAVVENMLAGVVEAGLNPNLVGKLKTKSTHPTWTTLSPKNSFMIKNANSGLVFGGTTWDFANSNTVERESLDLLVIDEAGQYSLAHTMGASRSAKRLLLLGDPQQLPQVSQGIHFEPVDESALGWLMDGDETISEEFGYFLGESYRMHPALSAKVSKLSYNNELKSAPSAAERSLEKVDPGLRIITLQHNGNRTESIEEADEIVAQVEQFIGLRWNDPDDRGSPRRIRENDIVVVAPYNAQVAIIRKSLEAAGFDEIRVGTVDKFQGQEAPICMVSMTSSSHGDVPRGMGFLLNRNRINVAVSRAKWAAIIVRSEALTSFMPNNADGLIELGAFIGLCKHG